MFACHLYPVDRRLPRRGRRARSRFQAARLGHHVALWCGDNELLGALTWFEESAPNRDRYLVAYDRLNRTIETALKRALPGANWWPSSPSPGPMSFGDTWHDDTSGDMHFWSVWHEGRDFEHYRDVRPRFCSEFGFQSYTSLPVIRSFADEADLNIASPVMESHQKNAGGNARIAETMFRYFRFPKDFANFVWLSPGPAGRRDQDRGRLLAQPEAALHGRALLAAQRHLAGRLLVEPRLRRRLEAPAPHGAALLPAGARRRHPRRRRLPRSSASTTPPRRWRSTVEPSPPPRWTAPPARSPTAGAPVGTDAAETPDRAPRRRAGATDEILAFRWTRLERHGRRRRLRRRSAASTSTCATRSIARRHRRSTAAARRAALSAEALALFVTLEADRPGRFSDQRRRALPRPRRPRSPSPPPTATPPASPSPSATSTRASPTPDPREPPMTDFSYQLYSSRNFPPLADTLKMLARLGYTARRGLRRALRRRGQGRRAQASTSPPAASPCRPATSASTCWRSEPGRVLEIAKAVGIETIYCPFLLPDQRPDTGAGYVAFGQRLQEAGQPYRDAGLGFGWHNHDFEFEKTRRRRASRRSRSSRAAPTSNGRPTSPG